MSASEATARAIPPLLGDAHGRYRVHIVGNSGAGKSTLGRELAALLGVPYVSLDTLFWQPGWRKTPHDEFRARIREAMDQSDRGWVVDGDYSRRTGQMIDAEATDTIWLDPPLALYFPRILVRTLSRMLGLAPSCSSGCPESVRSVFFSRDSILWWCLTNHMTVRRRGRERLHTDGVHGGGTFRRIGGWGRELATWKQSVRDLLRAGRVG